MSRRFDGPADFAACNVLRHKRPFVALRSADPVRVLRRSRARWDPAQRPLDGRLKACRSWSNAAQMLKTPWIDRYPPGGHRRGSP